MEGIGVIYSGGTAEFVFELLVVNLIDLKKESDLRKVDIMGDSMECLSGTTLGSEVSRSTKMRHQLLFGEIDASSSSCKT